MASRAERPHTQQPALVTDTHLKPLVTKRTGVTMRGLTAAQSRRFERSGASR